MSKKRHEEGFKTIQIMAELSCPMRFDDPEMEGIIEGFRKLHRTHQQNFFRTLLWLCHAVQNDSTDDRNKASINLARRIVEMAKQEEHYLPYI